MKRIANTKFARNNGILVVILLVFIVWTALIWAISARSATVKTTKRLTEEYDAIYEGKMEAFTEEIVALNTPTEDEVLARQMSKEADALAKLIGTMNTKQMKLSMLWNVLMRVDSPYYPNTVTEVVNQPNQWMFYKDTNPIRDDDVTIALEQLKLWHEGRYPAGLSATFVYGEWSEHDYVLRDAWEKNYKTNYWRYPDV